MNKEIRASKVRLIGKEGNQVGVVSLFEAMSQAESVGLDLVEVSPKAVPPVCKIVDYGKYRYQTAKREREQKKLQHQSKLKEVKFKPNIEENDLNIKIKKARGFIEKEGNKVRIICMFRGRQMAHPEIGEQVAKRFVEELNDVAQVEAPIKSVGRTLSLTLAPLGKKSRK